MKNESFYFYHLVNKDVDLSKGLFSLKYMYDYQMFDLFEKNSTKYRKRIVKDWNILKYSNRDESSLSYEEIMDAIDLFRGEGGCSYIYFFRYPPYEGLGERMKGILKYKDIYRIDINNEEVKRHIKKIFWGYEGSHSDNRCLDRSYYENIGYDEYFSKYEDSLVMNFANLSHIGIVFKDDFCPAEFLEKI